MILNIKPLSVNDAWKGRRFKTDKYKDYEKAILLLLKPMEIPEGKLELYLKWGFSSAGSDWDNPIKPFQDCLQKKYNFNDNRVVRAVTEKVKVKKGAEFIEWELRGYNDA
jgi:Holliday junction resolvase RusA-like endonuclease